MKDVFYLIKRIGRTNAAGYCIARWGCSARALPAPRCALTGCRRATARRLLLPGTTLLLRSRPASCRTLQPLRRSWGDADSLIAVGLVVAHAVIQFGAQPELFAPLDFFATPGEPASLSCRYVH
jgi:hypothetical protein